MKPAPSFAAIFLIVKPCMFLFFSSLFLGRWMDRCPRPGSQCPLDMFVKDGVMSFLLNARCSESMFFVIYFIIKGAVKDHLSLIRLKYCFVEGSQKRCSVEYSMALQNITWSTQNVS